MEREDDFIHRKKPFSVVRQRLLRVEGAAASWRQRVRSERCHGPCGNSPSYCV